MNKRYIDFVPAKRKPVRGNTEVVVKKVAPKRPEKAWSDEPDYLGDVPINQMFVEKAPPVGVSTGLSHTKKVEDFQPKFVKTEVKKRPLSVKRAPAANAPKMAGKASGTAVKAPQPSLRSGTAVRVEAMPRRATGAAGTPRTTGAAGTPRTIAGRGVANRGATGVSNAAANRGATGVKTAPQGMAKLQPTRAKFLNTNKIVKRPLSNNPYPGRLQPAAGQVSEPNPTGKAKTLGGGPSASKKKSEKPTVIITKPEKDSKVGLVVAIIVTIVLGAAAGTVAFLLLPK